MALIKKNTILRSDAFDLIKEGFGYIKNLDNTEDFEKAIQKWIEMYSIKSSDLNGPYYQFEENKNDNPFTNYIFYNRKVKFTKNDTEIKNLLRECIWDRLAETQGSDSISNKTILWAAGQKGLILVYDSTNQVFYTTK